MFGWLTPGVVLAAVALFAGSTAPVGTTCRPPDHHPAVCKLPMFGPGSRYQPKIDPGDFSPNVTNPWFPLLPGRTLVSTGVKDDEKALNLVITTSRTRLVDGVRTRVVEDRLYLNNVLNERTSDYYAQDRCGNVWYFGEDTAELDSRGRVVSTEGSFHAGVDGAQPGVFMQAHPQLGRKFRQEWYAGHAEDVFWAVARNATVAVPLGAFHHALRTAETNALEPDVLDNKYYVRGIGQVAELSVKGPKEGLRLAEIIR
ncbi:hypothetical protein E0H75_15975 [Kribbella capetownensis]|uniref:Uncharacterized protein n=1 Tax=Kribbella capetownensis TaxID=1572659 RepID=A0A4R0JTD8_9ACTN|nr:hypothetical protein [Kribbella capetownensis]TCC49817.1 hypothetical protein E0H75_15975 [Kribbella capetownensis]